jgi:bla regulator protein BlaR1
MPHLFLFLAKVNVALLIFCAGYYLVLRRLTFYTLNRIYLVGGILFATVYPKINLSTFLQRHQQIAGPVQAIAFRIQASPKQFIRPITHHGYWQYAEFIFWIGVILLALRLLVQFISLYRIYTNSHEGMLHGHKVRLISGDGGPFSFWKNIYINPDKHEPADLKAILQHEQIHIAEWHTADILLAEISTIFYWFNPGIWLMKKAVRENIEFITDRKILQNGTDSKQYQYSLVNVSFAAAPQGIVNHFNISTIKKRIIMMNTKKSSKFTLTRYAFLVPAVVALLLVVTASRAALVKKSSHYSNPVTAIKSEMVKAFTRGRQSGKLITPGKKEVKLRELDTTKHVKAPALAETDTNKKLGLTVKNNKLVIEPSMYIVDGVVTNEYDINKVDPNDIVSINIGKSAKGGSSVVYITTKNGMPPKAVTSIRINGSGEKTLKVR